eukprot:5426214-Amphidinium_carterae.1
MGVHPSGVRLDHHDEEESQAVTQDERKALWLFLPTGRLVDEVKSENLKNGSRPVALNDTSRLEKLRVQLVVKKLGKVTNMSKAAFT